MDKEDRHEAPRGVAHPAEESFTAYACAELEKLGHRQLIYDPYRVGFDPILVASELAPVGVDHPVSADIAGARRHSLADALTILYPLWWLSMPAMMKGTSIEASRAISLTNLITESFEGFLTERKPF